MEFPKKLKGFEAQVKDAYSLFTPEERQASCSSSLIPTAPSKLQLLLFRFNFAVLSDVFSKHKIEVSTSKYDADYLPVSRGILSAEKISVSLPLHTIVTSILKQQSESIAIIDSYLPPYLRNINFVVGFGIEFSSLIARIWTSSLWRKSLSAKPQIFYLGYSMAQRNPQQPTQKVLLKPARSR